MRSAGLSLFFYLHDLQFTEIHSFLYPKFIHRDVRHFAKASSDGHGLACGCVGKYLYLKIDTQVFKQTFQSECSFRRLVKGVEFCLAGGQGDDGLRT